jgi:hypothetical protein
VSMALQGHSLPPYAYALNNPLHFVDMNGYGPGKWDWTKDKPENYTQCIAAAKGWLNDYAKKLQDSLNEYLKKLEKELDKPNCDPQDVLNAQREALEKFNKDMAKLGEWMKNAEKNCAKEFPPPGKKKK